MKDKLYSRKDITLLFLISRRVIEGYEKVGLIKPTGYDKYSNNLYDFNTVSRIGYIRLYQLMGFKLKEIYNFIDKPINSNRQLFTNQINSFNKEINKFNELIKVTNDLLNGKDKEDNEWIFKQYKNNNLD